MKLLATLPDLRCQQRKGLKGRSGIGRIGVSPVLLPGGLSMRARLNDNEVRELCSAGRLHATLAFCARHLPRLGTDGATVLKKQSGTLRLQAL